MLFSRRPESWKLEQGTIKIAQANPEIFIRNRNHNSRGTEKIEITRADAAPIDS
jgi:hypothetical protein